MGGIPSRPSRIPSGLIRLHHLMSGVKNLGQIFTLSILSSILISLSAVVAELGFLRLFILSVFFLLDDGIMAGL